MQNLVSITPFDALVDGAKKTVNAILFTNFKGYDFSGLFGGNVEYAVGNFDGENFTPLSNGECGLPIEIVSNWGSDDSVIFDYVIEQKGFVKA